MSTCSVGRTDGLVLARAWDGELSAYALDISADRGLLHLKGTTVDLQANVQETGLNMRAAQRR